MGNLVEIQSQIEKLQKQATEIKAKEFEKTVRDILATMQAYGITTKDLMRAKTRPAKRSASGPGARAGAKRKSATSGTAVPAKFRGPNGETWSGRGLTPRWLAALVAEGRPKDEFAIKS
jgi:DNA-binding protein H-NS